MSAPPSPPSPPPISAASSSTSSQPIFDWPPTNPSHVAPLDPFDTFGPPSSSSEDGFMSAANPAQSHHRPATEPGEHDERPLHSDSTPGPSLPAPTFSNPPPYSRTISSPLPSRIELLQHPHSGTPDLRHTQAQPRPSPIHSISKELADTLQSTIQTLLHLLPPHMLDNAKEQYSGCAVQIPATSLSALLTSMKGLNFLSAQAETLFDPSATEEPQTLQKQDFDVGELLQSVADMLSGDACKKKIDFVLFHGDVGLKHVSVNGDSGGLAYALGHIIRQLLAVASVNDTIELGLQIIPQSSSLPTSVDLSLSSSDVDWGGRRNSSVSDPATVVSEADDQADGPLLCIFEIVHNIHQSAPGSASATPKAELNPFTRLAEDSAAAKPNLDTIFCQRLLQRQNALLRSDVQPSSPLGSGMPRRAYELSVLLPRGKPIIEPPPLSAEEQAVRQPFSSLELAREPTLLELQEFTESLRGRRVAVHANLSSVFARHLTSYLAAWGMDISHMSIGDGDEGGDREKWFAATRSDSGYGGSVGTTPTGEPYHATPNAAGQRAHFVIIDDDVVVLKKELARLCSDLARPANKSRFPERPTMVSRTKSTPSIRHLGQHPVTKPARVVLIHFTSLTNYNQVRDAIATLVGSPVTTSSGVCLQPEVMVIPKPVGPRRFLTALRTAVVQPTVDPFFSPIATSPRSPGGEYFGGHIPIPKERQTGFFDSVAEELNEEPSKENLCSQKARSPLGEVPPSAAQLVQTDHGLHLSLPTPGEIVATPAQQYFSQTPARNTAASGVVIQSPDGRPYGMFFEPPNKSERRGSTHRVPSETQRRISANRRASTGDELSVAPNSAPPIPRRSSTISTAATEERRNSIGSGNASDRPTHSRMNSRRTNNLPATQQPVVAVGRANSRGRVGTVTNSAASSKPDTPPIDSPIVHSPFEVSRESILPKVDQEKVVPEKTEQAERPEKVDKPKRALSAKAELQASIASSTAAKKASAKADVIVPPINVLIVEDNPINQNILSKFLRKKKINNQSAKDGAEAVEKWRTGGFHLILMDIQLPVMDGIAATKEIRRLERHNNIGVFPSTPAGEHSRGPSVGSAYSPSPATPFRSSVIIVALTASSLQSDRVAALAAGCNDFLTKPVSLKWLDKKIVEWGCMQALIDFDGWRRWKSSDASETRQGFSVGPQQAAKSLASRLRIERKNSRPLIPSAPKVSVQVPTPSPGLTPSLSTTTSHTPKPRLPPLATADPAPFPSPKALGQSLDQVFEQADQRLEKAREETGIKGSGERDQEASASEESTLIVGGAPKAAAEKPLPPLPNQL
ncbi:hypothetical protein I350_01325 [Cryptococcus amylolentus CBS 6273]|uniref:Response regulatory domain-containing protein n=1 Tax=Cryptococcus amylolentus CBS 6273 TaxID=1296118 RepID=A0A1E3KCB3_9TREE|nr:hypothetical protein I350_01325 [Cryptococcus amylolentus CBS 6273]